MIYIYGLSNAPPAALAGVTALHEGLQSHLELTDMNGWTLIHSAHDNEDILPKRRLLLAHTRILESVMSHGSLLPARFGLVAERLSEIDDLVRLNSSEIAHAFEKIEGTAEIGLRIAYPKDAALQAVLAHDDTLQMAHDKIKRRTGQAHFAIAEFGGKLADALDRRRGLAQRDIVTKLRPAMRDYVLRAPESDTEVIRIECLVPNENLPSFEEAVLTVTRHLGFAGTCEPNIKIIGPAPPYNFVTLNMQFEKDKDVA